MSTPVDSHAARALRIARRHGGDGDRVLALSGVVNHGFRVTGDATDWVVRTPVDPSRPNEYPVEAWAARRARLADLGQSPVDDAPAGIFSRFGRQLDVAWHEHVRYNREALAVDDALLLEGVYGQDDLAVLQGLVDDLNDTEFRYGLAHGDLAPRNLISRGSSAAPALIDWGTATTGPTPWTDFQRVYQFDHYCRAADADYNAFFTLD